MFDVMIIDDDPMVCGLLREVINFEKLSLNLVCEAADSDTARELYLIHRPKIIITDINIPFISGLELAEEFVQIDPEIRFIVITGYDNFDYVRKSVKLGAVDLLLKPIVSDSINESLLKAVNYFEKLKQKNASIESLQSLLENNLPTLRETFMAKLLNHPPVQPDEILQKMAELGINFTGKYFCAVITVNDILLPETARTDETVMLLIKETLVKQLEQAGFGVFSFFDSQFRLNCALNWNFEGGDNIIEEVLEKVKEHLFFVIGCRVYAGIGLTVSHPAELYKSHQEAAIAYNCQSVPGNSTIIHYKNIDRFEGPLPSKESLIVQLVSEFRANNFEGISRMLSQHIRSFPEYGRDGDRRLGEFLFEYVSAIILESIRFNLDIEKVESITKVATNLLYYHNPALQTSYVLDLTKQLQEQLFEKRLTNKNHLIAQAIEYIEQNLSDSSISLETVSENIGFSRIYFCQLFHKEVGVSFSNYLKQARVERAKKLLKESNLRVCEISDATGFANAKYFGYVFKQTVGMTPLEYQHMH